jgi:hypothetical protein
MESRILRILVSLGVPGVALGIFYLLFRTFKWEFAQVPEGWVGPIVVLFMLLTAGVVFYALTLWRPARPEPATVGEGVEATKKLFQTPVRAGGDVFSQRKKLAKELYQNCRRWSQILLETFDKAGERWVSKGEEAAAEIIAKQQRDLMKLDYLSLEADSRMLKFLREDSQFERFADACAEFYRTAIDLKEGVFTRIQASLLERPRLDVADISREVASWKDRVDGMLRPVTDEYHSIRTALG